MRADELYEHATERERYVDHEPIFIAAKVEYDAVVSHEIDSAAELPFYFGWIGPPRFGCNSKPSTDRALGAWVTHPEFPQGPKGDHLHEERNIMSPVW
jgi:hypothetical protein